MGILSKLKDYLNTPSYTLRESQLWAEANYKESEMTEAAEIACFTLCDMLHTDPKVLKKETRLLEDLGMDDIEAIEVSMALEEGGLKISPQQIMEASSLDGLIRLIHKTTSQSGS